MLKNLIYPIIVSVIVYFVQDYYRAAPTLTYAVSDAMEIVGSQAGTEYAQEVFIANPGRTEVKGISIKVPHQVTSYKVARHSNLVKEQTVSDATSFELSYAELPSDQSVRLSIRYGGMPIAKNTIVVGHAGGPAQPQDSQKPAQNIWLLIVAFWGGMLFNFLLDMKKFSKEMFVKFANEGEAFRDNKPWHATTAAWSEMQYESIEKLLNRPTWERSPDHTLAFAMLNREKPALLSEEHWEKLKKQAVGITKDSLSRALNMYCPKSALVDMLRLNKPRHLPLDVWDKFREELGDTLRATMLNKQPVGETLADLLDPASQRYAGVPDELRDEIRQAAQEKYVSWLLDKVLMKWSDPNQLLKSAKLELLPEEKAATVRERIQYFARAYHMPTPWLPETLAKFLKQGRFDWMAESEFDFLQKYLADAVAQEKAREELRVREHDVAAAESEVTKTKEVLTKKLERIHDVLTDPESIDRWEAYDDTFAQGNKQNLKRVAEILLRDR